MRDDVDGDEAMVPRVPNLPPEPSARQIAEHELTGHAVYRSWCRHCVASKGRAQAHSSREEGELPEIGIDYGFFGRDKEDVLPTLCVKCRNSSTGFVGATGLLTGRERQIMRVHAPLCQQQRRLSSRSLCNSGSQRSQACVCLCSQQHSLQLGPQSADSMRAALSVRHRRCHQITQQLGAFSAQSSVSLEDQRSHGRAMTLRLRLPSNCSQSWFRRIFVVTFCMRASRA